jgi:hypothetical protein
MCLDTVIGVSVLVFNKNQQNLHHNLFQRHHDIAENIAQSDVKHQKSINQSLCIRNFKFILVS